MVINKYIKDKGNKYKVYIDNEEYVFYDEIILKHGLLFKNEISNELLQEIMDENKELVSYYESVKYISKKMRSESEIRKFLEKKEMNKKLIDKTIKKLKDNLILNDELYIKCYVNDQINLTNKGKNKIINELVKKDMDEELVLKYINTFDLSIWESRIRNIIEKRIKLNKNNGWNLLKIKIINELVRLGYNKEFCESIISDYKVDDKESYLKEYDKIKRKLEKKYEGYDLEIRIKQKMYQKGFRVGEE